MLVVLVAMMLGSRDPLVLELKSLKTKPMLLFMNFFKKRRAPATVPMHLVQLLDWMLLEKPFLI